jgi:hypothetical protein
MDPDPESELYGEDRSVHVVQVANGTRFAGRQVPEEFVTVTEFEQLLFVSPAVPSAILLFGSTRHVPPVGLVNVPADVGVIEILTTKFSPLGMTTDPPEAVQVSTKPDLPQATIPVKPAEGVTDGCP